MLGNAYGLNSSLPEKKKVSVAYIKGMETTNAEIAAGRTNSML